MRQHELGDAAVDQGVEREGRFQRHAAAVGSVGAARRQAHTAATAASSCAGSTRSAASVARAYRTTQEHHAARMGHALRQTHHHRVAFVRRERQRWEQRPQLDRVGPCTAGRNRNRWRHRISQRHWRPRQQRD